MNSKWLKPSLYVVMLMAFAIMLCAMIYQDNRAMVFFGAFTQVIGVFIELIPKNE